MGMAASQARFLSLTARKTNTEFQGQQVNQQRTALSNESATLYNQMMLLEVPTPPSATSYYNYNYSFTNAAESDDGKVYQITKYSVASKTATIKYTEETPKMVKAGVSIPADDIVAVFQSSSNPDERTPSGKVEKVLRLTQNGEGMNAIEKHLENSDQDVWGNAEIYKVKYDGAWYYVTAEQIYKDPTATTKQAKNADIAAWKTDDVDEVKETELEGVVFQTDAKTGRIKSFVAPAENCAPLTSGATYKLDITKEEDEEEFEEAMRDYEYQKQLYEKRYADLDAKQKAIQKKDKNLELKLKQLDTEQNAIQTEMEAVKSVIKKNVEDTFKTFNA